MGGRPSTKDLWGITRVLKAMAFVVSGELQEPQPCPSPVPFEDNSLWFSP